MMNEQKSPQIEYKNRYAATVKQRDAVRPVPLYRTTVECATNGFVVGGYVINAGTVELALYDDEIEELERYVETQLESIAKAKSRVADEAAEFKLSSRDESERKWTHWVHAFAAIENREPFPLLRVKRGECLGLPKSEDERKAESAQQMTAKMFLDGVKLLLEEQSAKSKK